ncbi:MAG: hypothetical protein ACREBJ_04310 [Nitrosotalea sp.]
MPQQNKNNSPDPNTATNFSPGGGEETKDGNLKHNLSRFEYDLYHEEDDKSEKVIRVKRVAMPNKGEKWKIMIDNKILCIIEGQKLTKKEKEFLKTVDGISWLLQQAKLGIKSLNSFKRELKIKLSPLT